MLIQRNVTNLAVMFICLTKATVILSAGTLPAAAVATQAIFKAPSYGVAKLWNGLCTSKKLAAYQAFNITPLKRLPPGLLHLILNYVGSYSSFSVTAQELSARRRHQDGDMTPTFFNDCLKPLLAVHPTMSVMLNNRPLLHVYWRSATMDYDSLSNCCRTFYDFTAAQKVNPRYLRQELVGSTPFELQDATLARTQSTVYEHSKFIVKDAYLTDPQLGCVENKKEAEDYLDVCISDFDHELKGGSLIEGCRYSIADHELLLALMHVCSNRLTHEAQAELEAQAQKESKEVTAPAKKRAKHKEQ